MSENTVISKTFRKITKRYRNVIDFLYGTKNQIQNIIAWFPVIWNDRQFDHYYFYLILRKKIELMRDFFNSDFANTASAKDKSKKMNICVCLLNRLIEDNYDEIALLNKYYEKYPSTPLLYNNNISKKQQKEFQSCYKKSSELQKQDVEYLFKILSKQIRTWWD